MLSYKTRIKERQIPVTNVGSAVTNFKPGDLAASWSVLKGLGVIGSLVTIIERVRPAIEQMIGSCTHI